MCDEQPPRIHPALHHAAPALVPSCLLPCFPPLRHAAGARAQGVLGVHLAPRAHPRVLAWWVVGAEGALQAGSLRCARAVTGAYHDSCMVLQPPPRNTYFTLQECCAVWHQHASSCIKPTGPCLISDPAAGVKISSRDTLVGMGVDPDLIARRATESYLIQVGVLGLLCACARMHEGSLDGSTARRPWALPRHFITFGMRPPHPTHPPPCRSLSMASSTQTPTRECAMWGKVRCVRGCHRHELSGNNL